MAKSRLTTNFDVDSAKIEFVDGLNTLYANSYLHNELVVRPNRYLQDVETLWVRFDKEGTTPQNALLMTLRKVTPTAVETEQKINIENGKGYEWYIEIPQAVTLQGGEWTFSLAVREITDLDNPTAFITVSTTANYTFIVSNSILNTDDTVATTLDVLAIWRDQQTWKREFTEWVNANFATIEWAKGYFVDRSTNQTIDGIKHFLQDVSFDKNVFVTGQISVEQTTYSHDMIIFEDNHVLSFPEKSGTFALVEDINTFGSYTKDEIDAFFKNYYTKEEVDTVFYNKSEIDTRFNNYYSKTLIDQKLEDYVSRETLDNYYTKEQTNSEIAKAVASAGTLKKEIVSTLPTTGEDNVLYLVPKTGSTGDIYNEYLWINSKWEFIGTTQTDLTNYYNKTEVDSKLAKKLTVEDGVAEVEKLKATTSVETSKITTNHLVIGENYDSLSIITENDNLVQMHIYEADAELLVEGDLNLEINRLKLDGVLGTANQVPMANANGKVTWQTVYTSAEIDTKIEDVKAYVDTAIADAITSALNSDY